MDSSLLTQISLESPLPTLVEVEISRSLNAALKRAFHFFYLLAAESYSSLAAFLPYGDEIYLALHAALERFLIFNADSTFTELMFGLRRAAIAGPGVSADLPALLRSLAHHHRQQLLTLPSGSSSSADVRLSSWKIIRLIFLGPTPTPSPEERAMAFVATRERLALTGPAPMSATTAASDSIDGPVASAHEEGLGDDVLSPAPSAPTDVLPSVLATLADEDDEGRKIAGLTAGERMTASRASYGYLRFRPLSRTQRIISLFLLTLKPYVESKLKRWYMVQLDNSPDAVAMRDAYAYRYPIRAQLRRVFVRYIFPVLHVCQKSADLTFKLLYLCELTPYTSPLHRVFNIAVRRSNMADNAAMSPQTRRALLLARILFFVVFFSFQLFEFTRGSGLSSASLLNDDDEAALPVPPPPVWGVDVVKSDAKERRARPAAGADEVSVEEDAPTDAAAAAATTSEVVPGQCPVCGRPITNAAVLTTSGVLGCYPCLQSHVREHRACPITCKATSVEQIRRVFES